MGFKHSLKKTGKKIGKGIKKSSRVLSGAFDLVDKTVVPVANKLDRLSQKLNRATDGQLSRGFEQLTGFEPSLIRRQAKRGYDLAGKGVTGLEAGIVLANPASSKKERMNAMNTLRHVAQNEAKGRSMSRKTIRDTRDKMDRLKLDRRQGEIARDLQTAIDMNRPAAPAPPKDVDDFTAEDFMMAVRPLAMPKMSGKAPAREPSFVSPMITDQRFLRER